jgi:acetylglutamate kinase
MSDILVAKVGGSTLGSHDTTLDDLVTLRGRGLRPLVVHGGGSTINDWLRQHELPARFQRGLRVTDAETLRVAVAVLAGLVNKELVATLQGLGTPAVGLSGADGGLLRAQPMDESLGYVGQITEVDPRPLLALLEQGFIPVVAPIALRWEGNKPQGHLLNVNADTVAGAIARALAARWLVFLTDVPGICGEDGNVISRLEADEAKALAEASIVTGGMIPKVEACVEASAAGVATVIVNGRQPAALLSVVSQQLIGTWIG